MTSSARASSSAADATPADDATAPPAPAITPAAAATNHSKPCRHRQITHPAWRVAAVDRTSLRGQPSQHFRILTIKSYTKANGTVVDLSADPKNNTFFDTDVVSVTFQLKVISQDTNAVWASDVAYLFG